jgi:hypothetical protein
VHLAWRDDDGNISSETLHRNGYAKTVAVVANENHDWRDIGAQVADGHLIAAAPELFEALRGLVNVTVGPMTPEMAAALDALTKAQGEQS